MYTYIYKHAYNYTYMFLSLSLYIYIYIYIYVYTYIYTCNRDRQSRNHHLVFISVLKCNTCERQESLRHMSLLIGLLYMLLVCQSWHQTPQYVASSVVFQHWYNNPQRKHIVCKLCCISTLTYKLAILCKLLLSLRDSRIAV